MGGGSTSIPTTTRTATSSSAPSTTSRTRRGLATRYDKHALVYRGGVVLAAITLWLARIETRPSPVAVETRVAELRIAGIHSTLSMPQFTSRGSRS